MTVRPQPGSKASGMLEKEPRMKENSFGSLTIVSLVAGLLWIASPARGHHGWAEFDEKAEVTLQGSVTDFHYVNPHCVVEFLVKDEKDRFKNGRVSFRVRECCHARDGTPPRSRPAIR